MSCKPILTRTDQQAQLYTQLNIKPTIIKKFVLVAKKIHILVTRLLNGVYFIWTCNPIILTLHFLNYRSIYRYIIPRIPVSRCHLSWGRPASSKRSWLSTVKQAVESQRAINSEINWTCKKQTKTNTVFSITKVFQNMRIICYITVFSCSVSSLVTQAVYLKLYGSFLI